MTITDLDRINAELMGAGARNPFGADIQPGAEVSGEIISVVRRHRHNRDGQPLYWVNRKPVPGREGQGQPVIDSQLILDTDQREDEQDDGLRVVTLDRDVLRAINAGVRRARAAGIDIGGRLDGLMFAGLDPSNNNRVYDLKGYTPPAA
ncbi:hypothetical protein [Nocardia sp. NPDC050435]|uniref:hypothetical protein n=1 Tax=Nocardia sp. NPDC050435 TaxID=3155040 RepID=UPI003406C791